VRPLQDWRPVRFLVPLALVLFGGCAFVLPPSSTEIGWAGSARGTVTHVATGVHLASAIDTKDDYGVGYTANLDRCGVQSQAISLEYARRQSPSPHVRTSLGGRAVLFFGDEDRVGTGAFLRATAEVYGRSKFGFAESGHGNGAVAFIEAGAWGLGVYAEAGYQRLPDDSRAFLATTGLTLRLPFMAGLAVGR
jgi:hypothetical protein